MSGVQFTVRPGVISDCENIAQVHVASIRSLGARVYDAIIVRDWSSPLTADLYNRAMEGGTVFFIAVNEGYRDGRIIGFSSYSFVNGTHRTAVYVDGDFARCGVGTALFRAAQRAAKKNGAKQIDIDASVGAVSFYRAMGFDDLGVGEHKLWSGRKMACVFMRKLL